MRLTLTDDQGILLDSLTISPEDYTAEIKRNPAGILAQLDPGIEALARPSRFLVVTSSSGTAGNGYQLEPYLYGSSDIIRSYELERNGQPLRMVVVQVTGSTDSGVAGLAEQQADRFASGLHTVWLNTDDRDAAIAQTVIVRETLNAHVPS